MTQMLQLSQPAHRHELGTLMMPEAISKKAITLITSNTDSSEDTRHGGQFPSLSVRSFPQTCTVCDSAGGKHYTQF